VRRAEAVPLTMSIGGEKKTIVAEGEPRYSAYYELESAEVVAGIDTPLLMQYQSVKPGSAHIINHFTCANSFLLSINLINHLLS
jgi:hypothetical protein